MKRLAALIPAAVALAAGVFCIPAVSASATEITLTPQQTRALFGDLLNGEYHPTKTAALQDCQFEFYSYATIYGQSVNSTFPYTLTGKDVLVYRSPANFDIYTDGYNTFNLRLCPTVSLSGLRYFRMTLGLSTSENGDPSLPTGSSTLSNQRFTLSTDANNNYVTAVNFLTNRYNKSGGGMAEGIVTIDIPNSGVIQDDLVNCTNATIELQNSVKDFTVWMADRQFQGSGFYKNVNIGKPAYITNNASFNNYYYFFVECPLLSDTYVNNNAPESSGGGSESSGGGYDGPDYSEQLALILAKLDLIVNNDFNFDVTLDADLSGVESRLDGINSRLDGTNSRLDGNNSRLDGNNSRLDGVNSRLDGVNSRLDNISGELHGLNSAPSETLPSTGGENSEFEHQAEMYMSDFRNEFEDSENQVFEVIDKGTGFLGFVREIIITSHLAQILPLLALLFIAHYVIFERGG